ncbi:MAG TPA: rod shape-determining protein MreC [Candidatus Deferrimicrobiaceae bacterium]|jgi:rod shape-determining protein MreC
MNIFRKWGRPLVAAVLLAGAIQCFVRPPVLLAASDPLRGFGAAVFQPVYKVADFLRENVTGFWYRYLALIGVSEENDRLRKETVELRARLQESRDALLENRRLRELLQFAPMAEKPTMGARVVGHDVSPWFQAVYIDAGSVSGVEPGMAVTTPGGGIGRIHKTWRNLSEVLLATDGRFAADVIVERSRVRAVAEGMGGSFCRLKYVSPLADVAVGDRVLFSGFDGSMPKGTLLGAVVSVDKPKEGLFQKVKVQSAVHYQSVEELLVVLARPTIPFRGDSP